MKMNEMSMRVQCTLGKYVKPGSPRLMNKTERHGNQYGINNMKGKQAAVSL